MDRSGLTQGMVTFLKATARVSLVASEETRKRVAELTSAYGELFIELLGDAGFAQKLKIDININRQSYDSYSAERTRIISAMRETNEDASSNYKFETLERSFQNTVKPLEDLSAEYVLLSKAYNEALIGYGAVATEKLAKFSDLHAVVSGLLRSEFDLEVDIEGMKIELREQRARAQETARRLFVKLKESLQK